MAASSAETKSPGGFSRWWTRTSGSRTAWLYLIPAFLVMGLITFYPLFYQVWMSTTDYGITNLRVRLPLAQSGGPERSMPDQHEGRMHLGLPR